MSDIDDLLAHLSRHGLLLQQDKRLPSVVGLLVGGPIATSWWGHPKAHHIFRCLGQLVEHPDVLPTRLIGGKVTYLHRGLWPAFLSVATGQEAWQRQGLSPEARKLLREVERGKEIRATGEPARELQERLLVHADEVHTASGRHEVLLRPWAAVENRTGRVPRLGPAEGREQLERAAHAIGASADRLPWRRGRHTQRERRF
jgi:hypothetical protein